MICNKLLFLEGARKNMKDFFKGVVIIAAVLIVLIIINVIGNINGITLHSAPMSVAAACCSMYLFRAWKKKVLISPLLFNGH